MSYLVITSRRFQPLLLVPNFFFLFYFVKYINELDLITNPIRRNCNVYPTRSTKRCSCILSLLYLVVTVIEIECKTNT